MFFPLLGAVVFVAPAQTAKHSAATRKPDPDAEARAQLATYVADFQGNPDDSALRTKIIELAKSLNPPPPIPQLAQDDFSKDVAQMASASSPDDLETVAQLFEQVAVQAPWYADAYFNAASAYSRANKFDSARRNLALYLAASRPGTDSRNAEQLRHELDHKQTLQFQQMLQQFAANPTDAARLHVIQLAQALGTQPEIPEEARGHYVMAVVYGNAATDSGDYDRAITEYKAALLAAPWWGEAYKKLATAQTLAGRYDEAISSLIFYQSVVPSDSRNTQDEIYRLKALGQRADEDEAKKQAEDQKHKLIQDQLQRDRASADSMQYTVEGRWYPVSAPGGYFVGGESNPNCDYVVTQGKKGWEIKSSCTPPARSVDSIQVEPRRLSFRLLGRDKEFQYSQITVALSLSSDGQTLSGTAVTYDKSFFAFGDHPVRWARRK
jgi:tetratricopeptide (TPR) repeat protein